MCRSSSTQSVGSATGAVKEQSATDRYLAAIAERFRLQQASSQSLLEASYRLGEVLGEGAFAVVRLATRIESGDIVAIKTVKDVDFESEEVRLQRAIDHEGVVKIFDVIKENGSVHIIMEHMPNGTLLDMLTSGVRLTEAQARKYFLQLVDAVEACHAAGVAHRDLKAENIMLDEQDNVKIADFGLATEMLPGQLLSGYCGSVNYAAPELWTKGALYDGHAADVWSCGVVLYALLTGNMAYDADDIRSLVGKITNAEYKVSPRVSEEANNFLARIFDVKPASRISTQEMRQHKWISCA